MACMPAVESGMKGGEMAQIWLTDKDREALAQLAAKVDKPMARTVADLVEIYGEKYQALESQIKEKRAKAAGH